MRLIKTFGLAALAAVAAMAFVGASSASAEFDTVLCKVHGDGLTIPQLLCPRGQWEEHIHRRLVPGTVLKLLSPISILCLGVLSLHEPLELNDPQIIHIDELVFSGCGTGSSHDNCTITVEELPLAALLKTGLDQGILTLLNGRLRLQCSNLGINCVYDLEGMEFEAGDAGHLTLNETPTSELGGKFFCPDEGFLDGLLEPLLPVYILK